MHLTTCWCSLPSKLISDWHTRQFITGTPLASGLAMAVYGGGSSAARDKEISAEKPEDPKTLPANVVSSSHSLKKDKNPHTFYVYTKHRTNLCLLAPSPQLLCTQTSSTVVGKANQQHEHTVNHPRNVDPTKLIYVTLFSYQFFAVFRECTEKKTLKTPKPTTD